MRRDLDGHRSEASTDEHENRARLKDLRHLLRSTSKELISIRFFALFAAAEKLCSARLFPANRVLNQSCIDSSPSHDRFAYGVWIRHPIISPHPSPFLQHVTLSHLRLAIHSMVPPRTAGVIALNLHTPQDLCNPADPQTHIIAANEFESLSKPTQSRCSKLDLH